MGRPFHGQHLSRSYVLTPADWEHIRRVAPAGHSSLSFQGDPARFRLGIEAHRLRLAHSIDPYAALNASRIDPLPHQFEAVYEHLLARPVVRALLAHDAGAGKTIMAGMVIKELKRRQGVRRVLIVAPAGLTVQWRRELLTKFGENFAIISRDYMAENRLDRLDVWRETDLAITSIAFARQKEMRRALESVEWDLVTVDEAHKMAAYLRPGGSIRKTDAYELGEVLSRRAPHFLLVTATPHKGDPDNYRLLISRRVADLLAAVRHRADEEQVTPLPTEVLDGFDSGRGQDVDLGVRQVQPMLAGQTEVMDQCVGALFLPELAERRAQHQAALARDRLFLEDGLTALAEHLSTAAVGAYGEGDFETGDRLADQSTAVQQRLAELRIQMTQAEHLLMVAPEVLGVALVLPAPMPALSIVEEEISLELDEKGPPSGVPMRRDPEVEKAAIKIVMEYKAGQGRYPRDVSKGHSWDIESDNARGVVVRYIEVKGSGPEDANEVSLTENEWEAARRLGEQHWLYVVRLGDGMMWLIQNPYARLQPKELKRWIVKVRDVAEQGEAVVLERV